MALHCVNTKHFLLIIFQAANTTEMWIITNGIDDGISGMIGEAVREERNLRANSRINLSQIRPDFVKKFQKLTVIGVVPKPKIVYENLLDGSVSRNTMVLI